MIKIKSEIQLGKQLTPVDEKNLRYEPMLFSCDFWTAMDMGGLPTQEFLLSLPSEWHNNKTIIDSRVHMLMEGWYPCIPGYHHDDVPRERSDGQPDYHNPSYRSKHAMVLFNGGVCPTEFALGEDEFPDVDLGETYYKIWHPLVVDKINKGILTKFSAPENQIIFFNDRTWHQGIKAVKNGWRLFIRASRNTNRKVLNERREQVQVYLDNPMEGW